MIQIACHNLDPCLKTYFNPKNAENWLNRIWTQYPTIQKESDIFDILIHLINQRTINHQSTIYRFRYMESLT